MKKLVSELSFDSKVIFVDGLPGCGKTLISNAITSIENVELLSYMYEVEHVCALYKLDHISLESGAAQIQKLVDVKVYNQMMSRDVNFRYSDLSSVFKYHNPEKYFMRLFSEGDEAIPKKIIKEKPILNIAIHNNIAFSNPIINALKCRCYYINVLRHPVYMINQQSLNFKNIHGTNRDFEIHFKYGKHNIPYFAIGWEREYANSTPVEKSIYFIKNIIENSKENINKYKSSKDVQYIEVIFEEFVKDPLNYLRSISKILGSKLIDNYNTVLSSQNIPRDHVSKGLDLPIYRRCGWEPPTLDSEKNEVTLLKDRFSSQIRKPVKAILNQICEDYESSFWSPQD